MLVDNSNILADETSPTLQRSDRRAIFQHDNDLKHTAKITQRLSKEEISENYDLAKYATWLESNITFSTLKRKIEQHACVSVFSTKEQMC